MLDVAARLVHILRAGGEKRVFDLDNLLKREALDVIGAHCFFTCLPSINLQIQGRTH